MLHPLNDQLAAEQPGRCPTSKDPVHPVQSPERHDAKSRFWGCYATDASCRSAEISSVDHCYLGNIRGTQFFGNSLSKASLLFARRRPFTLLWPRASLPRTLGGSPVGIWHRGLSKKYGCGFTFLLCPRKTESQGRWIASICIPTCRRLFLVWLYRVESFHCSVLRS